ncbi:MAG: GNAT family N-acetyltransferase [Pseudomonadota bacterium]
MNDIATPGSTIETARLLLSPLDETHAGDFESLFRNDWEAIKQTGQIPFPATKEAMQIWIAKCSMPGSHAFCVSTKVDGQSIGVVGFGGSHAISELGYILGRAFWGQGYATEAVKTMVGLARSFGLGGLQAYSFVENPASARVLEKAGFSNMGTIVREYPKRGGMRRVMHFRTIL